MASTLKEMQEREAAAMGKSAKKGGSGSTSDSSTAAAKAALTRKFNKVVVELMTIAWFKWSHSSVESLLEFILLVGPLPRSIGPTRRFYCSSTRACLQESNDEACRAEGGGCRAQGAGCRV